MKKEFPIDQITKIVYDVIDIVNIIYSLCQEEEPKNNK